MWIFGCPRLILRWIAIGHLSVSYIIIGSLNQGIHYAISELIVPFIVLLCCGEKNGTMYFLIYYCFTEELMLIFVIIQKKIQGQNL